jgi:hypothetical protein
MNIHRSLATIAGLVCAFGAQAHDAQVSRYRVSELSVPDSLKAGCLSSYAAGASILRINDFGVVNAVSLCYTVVDNATGAIQFTNRTFVAAPWFGSVELPLTSPTFSYSYTVTNRGDLFGYEGLDTGGFGATRWTLGGGHERIFFDPACETIQFQAAVDGNGRYTVGWGLRGDSRLPPPVDQLCIRMRWVIRNAAGVETLGPLDGLPAGINAFDVAVGTSDRSAIRYHVPTGQTRVLHAADSAHSVEVADINDLGEVAGRITLNQTPDVYNQCDPSVAVRWERDGRERVLPHLPGAVSSHAFGVGYDGETVGDSGAGQYCGFTDNSLERAVLWKGGRAFDLNTLIPRSAGITLTYAYSVNRLGQITAGGYVNAEPVRLCPSSEFDPATGTSTIITVPCHNQHMFVLTPSGH